MRRVSIAAVVVLGGSTGVHAQPAGGEARFDNGQNLGGWSFGVPGGGVEPSGGNCAGFFLHPGFSAAVPTLVSAPGGPFSGEYVDGRMAASLDLRVFPGSVPAGERLAMMLISNNGTPGDPADDWGAYTVSEHTVPAIADGWKHARFYVPPGFGGFPEGWLAIRLGPAAPAPAWPALIQEVAQLAFCVGDPAGQPAARPWSIGVDNIVLEVQGEFACEANCDDSTVWPILNVSDFVCFTNLYAAGDLRANLDHSTSCPFLNVSDFIWFQMRYAAGCQ